MSRKVVYYHFGQQCYGTAYMGQQAEKAADLLGMEYQSVDIEKSPEAACENNIFFPGVIVIDDFSIVYPGSPEQLVESYKLRGPLPGVHNEYKVKPAGDPDEIRVLHENIVDGCGVCIPGAPRKCCDGKLKWLERHLNSTSDVLGNVAYKDGKPVAAVEWLPENAVPYPLPEKRNDTLFVTCIYNKSSTNHDYRGALLRWLKDWAQLNGWRRISIVAGIETPYPNGPIDFLHNEGFDVRGDLGEVLLRHKWEQIVFMETCC